MMASQSERTPLITRRQTATISDGRRRRGNASAFSGKDNRVLSPSLEGFDKEDRRGCCGRIRSLYQSRRQQHRQRLLDERYYEDRYNSLPWTCNFGTKQEDGIWLNRSDQGGIFMAMSVWLLIVYSGLTVTMLAEHSHLPSIISIVSCTICALAFASHAKCMFTDPGAIPSSAVPPEEVQRTISVHAMCSHCKSYKPPGAHHCRICNRCISRMDHHCPWMNNCIGAGNLKHFILFLAYTWTGAAFALLVFGHNYFLCNSEECAFSVVLVQLVRAMTVICVGALLFTSNMLVTVVYTVMTGLTTIDRLKRKATNTLMESEDEPINPEEIFGIQGYWTWPLPMDPVFEDYDAVMGYSTTERLMREQRDMEADPKGFSGI